MVILVEGQPNKIYLTVNPSIDISGFSATLAACGTMKTLDALIPDKPMEIEYTAEETAAIGEEGMLGTLTIIDSNGEKQMACLPFFTVVPQSQTYKAEGRNSINLAIVSVGNAGGGGGGGGGDLDDPECSVKSLQAWAIKVTELLRNGTSGA